MKRKCSFLAILLVICMFSLSFLDAAQAAADRNRVVNFAYQAITDSFDVGHYLGTAEGIAFAQVYDTLLTKDIEGNLQPCLAESWEISEDGLEYTFHLREGVKWHDGVPFTANDVVFSFDYLADAPTYSWIYKHNIERNEAVDDHTLKVYLRKPNSAFISFLTVPMLASIMAKHAVEEHGASYGTSLDKIVGTGAYRVTDWQPDVSITYEANEDYFLGVPEIKHMVFHQITDTNAAIVALQTGEMDLYFAPVSGSAYRTLSNSENIVMGEFISGRNEGIYMYCKDGLFSDVRMRKAVAYAVNKEDAVTVGVDGMGQIVRYPGDIGNAMTANPDYTPKITYERDIEKAKQLVKESGNEGAQVTIKSYNTDPYAVLATWLQSVLNEIGLDASVEPMERATFLAQCNAEQVTILPLSWNGQTYDIDEVLGGGLHSANVGTAGNYSFYINPEMDAMVEAARANPNVEQRKEIYRKIIDKFMEDVPFVSIYAVKTAIPRNVELTTANPRSYRMYDYTWAK